MTKRCLAGLLLAAASAAALAQSVALSGSLGSSKALLLIDGQPHTVAVGSTVKGVTLKRVGDGEAEVEIAGRTQLVRLGAAPASVGGAGNAGSGREIVLPVGPGGHFMATGSINGKSVQFMVDTGATSIAMSQADADRIGIDWKRGRRNLTQTAGGVVPVYGVNLSSVRVGDVEVSNVDAVVLQADMPMVLLGNSFLSRFTMRRDSDTMRLERR
ncbi:TIGR02281 family clan AA aspartic protease [Aquabacterium sp.]|uniref:retropepsin-like aspartic protease family protein n=1 Tax=Aquabacterium sp. TaxID=1872578 RepID=UPI003783B97B